MVRVLWIIVVLFLASCANQSQNKQQSAANSLASSDYENQLKYPEQVYSLAFMTKKEFDDPMWGVQLRYAHIFSKKDIIDVFIYPINATSWDEQLEVLQAENTSVLAQIAAAAEQNQYKSHTVESSQAIKMGELQAVKSTVEIVYPDDEIYRSFVYLFLQQDKYIKFRFSFLKGNGAGLPNEDNIAEELISQIQVPAESPYMSALRENHRKQQANQLLKMLMQSMEKQKTESADN